MAPPPTEPAFPGRRAVSLALLAAGLFGLSTPAAKALLNLTDPWLLAGLLYLGSGLGLGCLRGLSIVTGRKGTEAPIRSADVPWLLAAIVAGGVIGPGLLMLGLSGAAASQVSLLLNLEGVLTALLAWFVFREHFDARIATGIGAITIGALVLAWQPGRALSLDRQAALVAGACLAWALDNNLTRKVAGADAVLISALKGGTAGLVNLAIALVWGAHLPALRVTLAALVVGFLGYGVSLTLFVRALRELGAARTGAYFSVAPFVGAVVAVTVLAEPLTGGLIIGALLMALGVWLHVTEGHAHEHVHEPLAHEHRHRHDAHHLHAHDPGVPADEPHSHWHEHGPLRHRHPHYPDLHHRHPH